MKVHHPPPFIRLEEVGERRSRRLCKRVQIGAIEAAGGFKLPQDLDRSYRRLVQTYADTLGTWGRTASAGAH